MSFGNVGTTSACAENTAANPCNRPSPGNYLRVRGEYTRPVNPFSNPKELPPRARRIHPHAHFFGAETGTTSACAENTRAGQRWGSGIWNYLRVRGEYTFRNIKDSFAEELPPRARRIHVQEFHPTVWGGTTSACAENTAVGEEGLADIRNYLRVRGEYLVATSPPPR